MSGSGDAGISLGEASLSANLFDLVLLVVLAAFALLSSMRGALKEFITLVGLAVGYWAGVRHFDTLGAAIEPIVQDASLAELLAFLILIALGYLVGTFLSGLSDLARPGAPSLPDRVIGTVVGLGKGVIICLALYWIIVAYITPFQDEVANSFSAPYLERLLAALDRLPW